MNTKTNIVNQIRDLLGGEGSLELAEKMFDAMRADDRIYYAGDYEGLVIREDVDLIAVAVEVGNA
ncbi:hypothetical protein HBDW_19490 [Herbaspirillum sp. DW155]|uniref:hypothetical protein n=1 Tax=Herbaspirillum sp. DW155 TaxID=3095609 RepID=UPI00308DA2B5|nr:hypothetical protein HBDW_19490 [Herbaspirillum sp. DW155]